MGVCCVVVRLQDETIDELLAAPRKIWHFYSPGDPREPKPVSPLGRLLGFKPEPYPECSAPRGEDDSVDLDKAWDGIDYLLSDGRKNLGICRLLTMKGERINEEIGYGRPYAFRSALVREFNDFLGITSAETLRERYDDKVMTRARVYPNSSWDPRGEHSTLEAYLIPNYENLKAFIGDTAKYRQGVIVFNL